MNFWYRYISGYVRVSLEGIAPERFLNLCHNRGYAIWDIQYGKERNTCCMLLQDFLQIRPLARKTGTKVRVLHRYGAPFAIRRHWKRKGAILGITLFFVLLYLMSDHIWAIDVEGNHRYTEDTLLQFVTSTGISHGMKRDAISCEDLEKAIRNQYGDITWVSARIDGTRLVVQIKENDTGVSVTAKESEPFRSLIDPDDPRLAVPGDLPGRVREICRETAQPIPETVGAVTRCIYESLALKYRQVFGALQDCAGKRFPQINVVGGGTKDGFLCGMTAQSCGVPVFAGPTEATVLGNLAVQLLALGALPDVSAARAMIAESFPLRRFEPANAEAWQTAYRRYLDLFQV